MSESYWLKKGEYVISDATAKRLYWSLEEVAEELGIDLEELRDDD